MHNKKVIYLLIFLAVATLALSIIIGPGHAGHGSIQEAMRDAVLHETKKIDLFGIKEVNPALVGGFVVTGILLFVALLIRLFVIPKFKNVPGKIQLLLEQAVSMFDGMAKENSPYRNKFLSVYIFCAAAYIFFGTLFELLGLQAVATNGHSVTLPAPLSDINAAIALGFLSFFVIMSGGIATNGIKGVTHALKDFSLPISMSFRLFGALLSGLLVTDLVYHFISLSFVLPVIVAVLFTLLHALIQSYVLTMLTALFYGGSATPHDAHHE